MNIDLSKLKTADGKIQEAKDAKLHAVNSLRDQKEAAGFPYFGKTFDSDERSAARIFGAVQAAQAALSAGQPFVIDWTVQDNTTVTMDAAATIGMSVAMAQHAGALHVYARSLKDQIAAASTQAALDGIDIGAGWPA